jgi:hypothetical protein
MSVLDGRPSDYLRQLVALDVARLASLLRRPTPVLLLAIAVPMVLFLSALWTLGRVGAPEAAGAAGGLTLGMLVSGPVAFMAYGLLFRSVDDNFLRQLGVPARAIYLERSGRLGVAAASMALALVVPFAAAGEPVLAPLAIGLAASGVAAGTAVATFGWAARLSSTGQTSAVLSAGMRQFDRELARAAPLVYAPLAPFLTGAAVGAGVGAAGPYARLGIVVGLGAGLGLTVLGASLFAPAAPRFLPHVGEMAYSPPPEGEGEAFRVGRGLSRLLPRRAAAVWVRDATVTGRRFAWAARITWPVALVSLVSLARWGSLPVTRVWVVAAVGLALIIQSAAVVGLGRLERTGPRWIDRSAGLAPWERFLGRWVFAWGLSLWLLVPLALAWAWWAGVGGAWLWPLAGAVLAAVATTVSLLNAEPR